MSKRHYLLAAGCLAALGVIGTEAAALQEPTQAMPAETVMAPGSGSSKSDFPSFDSVTKDYSKVTPTADGQDHLRRW